MTSLVSAAERILARAKELERVLEQNNIPLPSFDEDTLESLPENARKLRDDLLDESHDLRQIVRGARGSGLEIAYSWIQSVIMRVIWRYKLASAVPAQGSASYQKIADTSRLSVSIVTRVIRAATSLNIFDETQTGQVRHTAISRLLATHDSYYSAIGLQIDDLGPASLKLIEAWEIYGNAVGEPEKTAFSLSNRGKSFFTVLTEEPDRAHRFDSAMKYYAEEDHDLNMLDVVQAFDWSTLDKPGFKLVDLGGGYGQVCQTLARHTQNLTFVIQDLPHVVEEGQKRLPPELTERFVFTAQDFMQQQQQQQPGESLPEAYMISRCLHNWSDHHSAHILRSLIPTLQKGSRILIWDSVLDDHPVKKLSKRFNLQQDFIMATIFNGKDRTAEEFRQVLELSDERFVIENIRRPDGCNLSMIEVSWNG